MSWWHSWGRSLGTKLAVILLPLACIAVLEILQAKSDEHHSFVNLPNSHALSAAEMMVVQDRDSSKSGTTMQHNHSGPMETLHHLPSTSMHRLFRLATCLLLKTHRLARSCLVFEQGWTVSPHPIAPYSLIQNSTMTVPGQSSNMYR
jgi:hypothetical protein